MRADDEGQFAKHISQRLHCVLIELDSDPEQKTLCVLDSKANCKSFGVLIFINHMTAERD